MCPYECVKIRSAEPVGGECCVELVLVLHCDVLDVVVIRPVHGVSSVRRESCKAGQTS